MALAAPPNAPAGNLAESKVPDVILDVGSSPILAAAIVPLVTCEPFKAVRDAPDPLAFNSVPDAVGKTITAELPSE